MRVLLRSLRIVNYEQFFDVPEIKFSAAENIIIGANGAGKTSLLRLIEAVCNLNFEELKDQAFEIDFELEALGFYPTTVVCRGTAKNERSKAGLTNGTSFLDSAQVAAGHPFDFFFQICFAAPDTRVNVIFQDGVSSVVEDGKDCATFRPLSTYEPLAGAGTWRRNEPSSQRSLVQNLIVQLSAGSVMRSAHRVAESDDDFVNLNDRVTVSVSGDTVPSMSFSPLRLMPFIETAKMKEILPSVRDPHSLELVGQGSGFPAPSLRKVGTSWCATVERLEQ